MENRKIRDELDCMVSFLRQKHKEFMLEKLQRLGLKTNSRGSVLYAVYENEGMVQDDISTRLSMDKAFVTRELNALAELGLVTRLKDPQDHRKNHIFLSEEGKKIGEEIVRQEEEWVKFAYAGLATKDFEDMIALMKRIQENIT